MTREEKLAILKQEKTSLTGQPTFQLEDSFIFKKNRKIVSKVLMLFSFSKMLRIINLCSRQLVKE